METHDEHLEARRRELARALDCLTSEDLRALAGITEGTEEAWRKRGTGPDYALVGNTYLYPIETTRAFVQKLVRVRRQVLAKALL